MAISINLDSAGYPNMPFDPIYPPSIPVPTEVYVDHTTLPPVKRIRKVAVRKPKAAPLFKFESGEDGYTKGFNVYDETGHRLCHVTSSIGHCCAASTIGSLSMYGFWDDDKKVDAFIAFFRKQWEEQELIRSTENNNSLHVFIISGFYILLSQETQFSDKAIRNHPNVQKVHSFKNKRCGPRDDYSYQNTIDLYFLEF
jgi:hypothetical protein